LRRPDVAGALDERGVAGRCEATVEPVVAEVAVDPDAARDEEGEGGRDRPGDDRWAELGLVERDGGVRGHARAPRGSPSTAPVLIARRQDRRAASREPDGGLPAHPQLPAGQRSRPRDGAGTVAAWA